MTPRPHRVPSKAFSPCLRARHAHAENCQSKCINCATSSQLILLRKPRQHSVGCRLGSFRPEPRKRADSRKPQPLENAETRRAVWPRGQSQRQEQRSTAVYASDRMNARRACRTVLPATPRPSPMSRTLRCRKRKEANRAARASLPVT
jgi:hypothetical protein